MTNSKWLEAITTIHLKNGQLGVLYELKYANKFQIKYCEKETKAEKRKETQFLFIIHNHNEL